jgi:hypothetical protein
MDGCRCRDSQGCSGGKGGECWHHQGQQGSRDAESYVLSENKRFMHTADFKLSDLIKMRSKQKFRITIT